MKYLNQLTEVILELRNFGIFWLGESVSEIGSRLTGFGLGIWVYQNTHAVAQLSLVLFFTTLPGVLITPFVGALVDRWNRKLVIICSEIAAILIASTLLILLIEGDLELWYVYISAFFTSVCGCFQMTAKAAALPLIVPSHQIGRANGLNHFSTSICQLAAPALAGILIVNIQLQGLLIVDLLSYLFTLTTLIFVNIPQPELHTQTNREIRSILDDIARGWESISSNTMLVILLVFMTIYFIMNGMNSVLINPLILSFSTATNFGNVMSIAGCGMVVGSFVMSIWGGGEKKSILPLFVFAALNGVAMVITGIKSSLAVITLGVTLSFFTLPIILSVNSTIWQKSVNANVQGRVISLFYTITGLGVAFGNISASPLTDQFLEPMLADNGLLASTVGLLIETGEGRGIGFLMIIEGLILFFISIGLYIYFYFQHIEEFNEKSLAANLE